MVTLLLTTCRQAFCLLRSDRVSGRGTNISADLGNSSNYSNEASNPLLYCSDYIALRAVVEKVSL